MPHQDENSNNTLSSAATALPCQPVMSASAMASAVLTHDMIIKVFFEPDESMGMEEIEIMQDLLEARSDNELFSAGVLQRVLKEKKGLQYIVSILHADPSSRANGRRRYRCYSHAMEFFKTGEMPDEDGKMMLETLMTNLKLMDSATSNQLAAEALMRFNPTTLQQVRGCAYVLELVSALAAHATKEQRAKLHSTLCELKSWPAPCVAMMAATLVDLSDDDEACLRSVEKISCYVRWKKVRVVSRESNFTSNTLTMSPTNEAEHNTFVLDNNDNAVEPEELPAIMFQIASLGRRAAASAEVKAAVVGSVCSAMDLLVGAIVMEKERVGTLAAGGPAAGAHAARIDTVLATIIHHLAFLLCKDDGLCAQVLLRVKTRQLYQQQGGTAAKIPSLLSPGLLLTALLVALAPRHEARVLEGLCDCVVEIFNSDITSSSSLWYHEGCWRAAITVRPGAARVAFSSILQGPQMAEVVSKPLAALAFAAIECGRAGGKRAAARLHAKRLSEPSPPVQQMSPHAAAKGFGSWLLLQLFGSCDFARSYIVKELVARLGAAPEVGPVGGASCIEHAAEAPNICIFILSQLARSGAAGGLLDVSSELQESLQHLQHLQPFAAGKLIEALSPLLSRSAAISDRCALVLRKATFSQDDQCRRAAVSALVAMLRTQVSAALAASGPQRSSRANLEVIRGGSSPLALDEVLALLRRFMKHQAPVRCSLYALLHQLQRQHPELRDLVLQLLLSHLQSIVRESRGNMSSAFGAPSAAHAAARGRLGSMELNLVACLDSTFRPQERPLHLVCTLLAVVSASLHGSPQSMSQGLSQGYSSTQAAANMQMRGDALNLLWQLCYSTGSGDDLRDFDINVSEDTDKLCSAADYSKLLLLLDCTRACVACVLALPAEHSEGTVTASERFAMAGRLSRRLEALQSAVEMQQKLQRVAAKELKKGGGGDDNDVEAGGLRTMQAVTETNKADAAAAPPLYIASCELLFAATCLDLRIAGELAERQQPGDAEDAQQQPPGNLCILATSSALLASGGHLERDAGTFLGGYALERMIDGLEALLAFLDDANGLAKSNQQEDHFRFYVSAGDVQEALLLLPLCESLLLVLLRALRDAMKKDMKSSRGRRPAAAAPDEEGNDSSSSHTGLLLRGILGCVKVQVAASRFPHGMLGTHFSAEGWTSPAERLFALFAAAWKTSSSGSSSLGTAGTAAVAAEGALDRSVSMLLRLLKKIRVTDRTASPFLVAIIGELLAQAPPASRKAVANDVWMDCADKVKSPPGSLAVALISLFVLQGPSLPPERLLRIGAVAELLRECADSELACRTSLLQAAAASLGILEGALGETDALLRLVEKRSARQTRKKPKKPSSSGHISSEDDDDDGGPTHRIDPLQIVHVTLQKLLDAAIPLLHQELQALGERAVVLLTKVYKLLVRIAKGLSASAATKMTLPATFLVLGERANDHREAIGDFMVALHNGEGASASRLSRLLPDLTFQMEQMDLQVIKLLSATRDKASVSRLLRDDDFSGRSFRLEAREEPEEGGDENDDGGNGGGRRGRGRRVERAAGSEDEGQPTKARRKKSKRPREEEEEAL